jgi:hypothetical protein
MKQNLVVFLADLFNVLEIHPVKCVRFPGTDRSLKEGETEGISEVASVEGIQQQSSRELTGAILSRSGGSRILETANSPFACQCRTLLSGAGKHLFGPQLPQP